MFSDRTEMSSLSMTLLALFIPTLEGAETETEAEAEAEVDLLDCEPNDWLSVSALSEFTDEPLTDPDVDPLLLRFSIFSIFDPLLPLPLIFSATRCFFSSSFSLFKRRSTSFLLRFSSISFHN